MLLRLFHSLFVVLDLLRNLASLRPAESYDLSAALRAESITISYTRCCGVLYETSRIFSPRPPDFKAGLCCFSLVSVILAPHKPPPLASRYPGISEAPTRRHKLMGVGPIGVDALKRIHFEQLMRQVNCVAQGLGLLRGL